MQCLTTDEVARYIVADVSNAREHAAHVDRCEPCRQVVAAAMRAARNRPAGTGATALQRPAPAVHISIDDTQLQPHARTLSEPVSDAFSAVDPHRYAIDHEIARGGMGRILAARDRRLGRPIAIKELLVGATDLRARFEREARITARLQHPAIVNLIEAGAWPTGEPFYVMKLVTGESLDKAISGRPRLEERLSLLPNVIAAADALAYAHSRRVIHRDLKPANVIVGEFGETVVIDWGLAKDLSDVNDAADAVVGPYRLAHGSVDATQEGSVLGTPAYMPAEQALGNAVDERADVYALGAMLYHVLSGAPPYTGKTSEAILAEVVAGPPASIADAAPGTPNDLVAIVDKAMAHAAADRYPTARRLAEDLKRFQTGQLVGAHRYSTWQLVRRWVRRHRAVLAVATAAVVVVAILGALSLRKIFHEQAQTEHQRQLAVANRGEAEDLINFMLVNLRDKLQPLGRVDLLGDVADKAVRYYDQRQGLSNAELAKLVRARRNLGDVFTEQSNSTEALREYRGAAMIATTFAALEPKSVGWQRSLATSRHKVGNILLARGDTAGAVVEYRSAMAITKTLAEQHPDDFDILWDLGDRHEYLAGAIAAVGDSMGALAERRACLAIRAQLAALKPQHRGAQSELSSAHNELGDGLLAQMDTKGALVEYRASLAIAEQLLAGDRDNANFQRNMAASYARIGDALMLGGANHDPKTALDLYEKMLAISKKLGANDPTNGSRQRDLAASYSRVADAILEVDPEHGPRNALPNFRGALAIFEKLAAEDPKSAEWQSGLSLCHIRIGKVLAELDDRSGAIREFRAALAVATAQVANDPTNVDWREDVATSHQQLAKVAAARDDYKTALAEFKATLKVREELAAADPKNTATQLEVAIVRNQIASAQLGARDLAAAIAGFESAIAQLSELAKTDPEDLTLQQAIADYTSNLGDALAARHDKRAKATYRAALAIATMLAQKHPDDADAQSFVTDLQHKLRH